MEKTLKDLYKEIRKTQFDLCCEQAMRSIESHSKEQFIDITYEKHINLFVKGKNYFLQFLNVLNSKSELNKEVLIDSSNISPRNAEPLVIPISSFVDLIKILIGNQGKKLKDEKVQRYLSFSLFPALSSYFTIDFLLNHSRNEHKSENVDFCYHDYNSIFEYLIKEYKSNRDPKYREVIFSTIIILMNPMFASPYFVRFNKETFQPVFSELQDTLANLDEKEYDGEIKKSVQKLKEKIQYNAYLIPSFIATTMRILVQTDFIIKKCFLNLAFESPNMAVAYGLFHFSKPPDIKLLTKIHSILELEKISDNLLTSIGQSFGNQFYFQTQADQNGKKKSLFVQKEELNYLNEIMFQYQFKKIFQTFVLSRTDLDLLNHILNDDTNEPFKISENTSPIKFFRVILAASDQHDEEFIKSIPNSNKKSPENQQQMTMREEVAKNLFTPSLRHLLQCSDPLPKLMDDSFLDKMDAESLLLNFLVLRGDAGSLSSRMRNFSNLQALLNSKDTEKQIQILLKLLPETLLEQTNEIETLAITSKIQNCIDSIIANVVNEPLNCLNIYSKLISLDSNQITNSLLLKNNIEYVKNYDLLLKDFQQNLIKLYGRDKSLEHPQYASVLLKMIQKKKKTSFFGKEDTLFYLELKDYFYKNNPDKKIYDEKFNNDMKNLYDEIVQESIEYQFHIGKYSIDNNNNDNVNNNNNDNVSNNNNDNVNNNNNDNANYNSNANASNSNNENNNNNDNNDNYNNDNNNVNNNNIDNVKNNNDNNDNNNVNNNNIDNVKNNNDNNDNNNVKNNNDNNDNNNVNNNNIDNVKNNNDNAIINSNNANDKNNDTINDKNRNNSIDNSNNDAYDENANDNNENDGDANIKKKFDKVEFIVSKIDIMRNRSDEIIEFCSNIFCETSIFRLVERLTKFLSDVYLFILEGLPKDEEFGANETSLIFPIIILIGKPMNIQLLSHFIGYFNSLEENCFSQEIQTAFFSICATIQIYDDFIGNISQK